MDRDEVLANLYYFTEWGGRSWNNLCRYAIQHIGELNGKKILELGSRSGRMSSCFGLLGAEVVGLEVDETILERAEKEARKWGVHSNVLFFHYGGDLDCCDFLNETKFDLIFTKSVLVLVGLSRDYLQKLERRLKPGGECVFLENKHGGIIFALLRLLLRHHSKKSRAIFLKPYHLKLIDQVFDIIEVKQSLIPPIYLIIAKKKHL